MSTQVSDLYKKHHEVSDNIKSIQESIKDLAEELIRAKAENKGLQSEIILLVKQIASLEKIVNTLNLAQKLQDQKAADVKSSTPVAPGIAPRASTTVKGHGDANTPLSIPPKDNSAYVVDPKKGIVPNPNYKPPTTDKDDAIKDGGNTADDGTADQIPPF
jgi:hypothetical protein